MKKIIVKQGERFKVVLIVEEGKKDIYEVRSKVTDKIIWNTFSREKAVAFWKEEEENFNFNQIEICYYTARG